MEVVSESSKPAAIRRCRDILRTLQSQRQAGSCLSCRHDKRLAVFAREKLIRLMVVGEALRFRIHLQEPRPCQSGVWYKSTKLAPRWASIRPRLSASSLFPLPRRAWLRATAFAEAIGNVAGMNQRGGNLSFRNVRVQVSKLAAADGLDEILKMVAALFVGFDFLAVLVA
jgi:hypothetical protein